MRTKRNALADALAGVDPSPLPQPRYAPFGPLPANGLNFAPLPSPFAPYPLATYLREPALTELYPVWGEPAPVVRNRLDRSAIEEILRHHYSQDPPEWSAGNALAAPQAKTTNAGDRKR